ncbi:MAG TPA: PIG-L deacetylase family protein [Candidatus Dormibacteraeota bacterium]|nr:PIG-L deacetylase family protein [Candidatus Dormibacteraeota bacterium]
MPKKKVTKKPAPRSRSRSSSQTPKFERVLVVSAHPDDPDFGAGGSIARLADNGARVTYVIVTDGSQGGEDPKQKDVDLVAIRQKEQRAAARVLGVKKVEFLGYKDGHLSPDLKLRHDIVRMIRKHKPELVITHIPGRVLDAPMGGSHPDHLAVGEATMAAVYPDSRNPRAFRSLLKEGLEPHEVKEVWIPFWTAGDYLVDISSTLDRKIQALRKHKSQVAKPGREWDFEKFMRKRHSEVGKRGGYRFAESFKRITV